MLHPKTKSMLFWSTLTPTVLALGMSLGVVLAPAAASANGGMREQLLPRLPREGNLLG